MKKIIITLGLWFLVTGLWAQNDTGAKIVPVSQAIQNTVGGNKYTIQVGVPYLGQNKNSVERITFPGDIRFPWDVLYLFETFAEESIDVSKGYFGDKILINWELRANFDLVTKINIYRKEYNPSSPITNDPITWGDFVISLDSSDSQYEDKYVEGGVLYEYTIAAKGVSTIENKYTTFITGIGFRNPTAIVTGNVSYKGGNPVKDVTIRATSEGSTINLGSALNIPSTGQLEIIELNKPITTATTLQGWMRPESPYTNDSGSDVHLFQLKENLTTNAIDVAVNLLATSKILKVTIGGSEYRIRNLMPSGKIDARGDDELIPVTDFNNNFVHFSVVIKDGEVPLLYINGRPITTLYADVINTQLDANNVGYTGPYFDISIPTITNSITPGTLIGSTKKYTNNIYIGGGNNAVVDEIRVWDIEKDATNIRTNFKRYISGNNVNLITYLSANEGAGEFAYDKSSNGFKFNKNNGKLVSASWANGSGNIPTANQLGVLGVTDINGNYEITAIPYSGNGESFNITPLYGNHQFEPSQQLVYLGQGSEVVNKINFIDKSSFSFKGKVLFDTRGVFMSFVEVNSPSDTPDFTNLIDGDEYISGPGILDEGYNYYEKNGEKFSKGEYWYNTNGTLDETEHYLERYARISSEGVNIYIDGNIVLDENNSPVVSDAEGNFDVSVPIGNHYVTLRKDGHVFAYNGRFPAALGTFKEFFEDSNEPIIFIDETRVTVVGRVVGGPVEAEKVIGFGEAGLFEKSTIDSDGKATTLTISSKNNIGVAAITLGHKPGGSPVTPYTKTSFTTNSESGEYRVALLPLNYDLRASDLTIPSAASNPISILELGTTETFNVSNAVEATIPEFEGETGEPYHYEKSFTYRSTPVLKVVEQTSDANITIKGQEISTEGFIYPIYSQFADYEVVLNRFERYTNYDDGIVEDLVPVIDGDLLVNNNLALADSDFIEVDPEDGSILTYKFKGGIPAISHPFTLLSTLKYRINGTDFNVENYKDTGIILGGKSDGSQTFVTAAPDIPDIILRDPPGSNSFASIEKGQSITFTTESSFAHTEGISTDFQIMLGVSFETGGGLAGPVIDAETKNNIDVGIGISGTSTDGKSLTKTYTFSQTISTSDDPDYVGSEGDLYIGNSKNQFYGSFDDIQSSTAPIGTSDYLELKNSNNESVFVSKQKAIYFVEEPSETFFVFSQKHILTTLIPEYELFIYNIENGLLTEGADGTLTIAAYQEQIRLWRKVILDNEKSKFLAKNDREKYKTTLSNIVNNFNIEITKAIDDSEDPLAESNLKAKLDESEKIKNLLNKYFDDNISFDAGVGEFTRSIETSVIVETSTEYNLTLDEDLTLQIGFNLNDTGIINTTNAFFQQDINTSLSEEEETTANISYTLKDNDPANLLSIDVINSFDGNGPIFITQGGRTSCPYEGPEESKFFTQDKFVAFFAALLQIQINIEANRLAILANEIEYEDLISTGASTEWNRGERATLITQKENLLDEKSLHELNFSKDVDCCPEDEKAKLSFATQRVENIQLTIEGPNDISNVPEGRNAEFVLKLENLSDIVSTNPNYNYFDLVVANNTNPNNAIFNIAPNGNSVYVPYGKPVYFKLTLGKSISDVYDYKDIAVYLASSCDPNNVYSEVLVSAHFIPSCSEVIVNAPLDNWTYNIDEAYNLDGTTKPLMINMIGFNTSFDSFKKIDLEYRLATSPSWSRLHTYYGTQAFYDAAVVNAESEISLISSPTLSYSLDIATLKLQDGNYEIRARSSCTNDTEYISDIITGRVDLHAPQKFGTPLPIDGILGAGEDLRVSFNENIFYNQAVSNIEIKGQTNQLPINHSVSLHFEGVENTAVINNPRITSGDITFEFWMNNSTPAIPASIIAQEDGLNIRLENGEIYFTLGMLTAHGVIANDNLFHHYTFTHKNSTGEISIYQDDTEIAGNTGVPGLDFTNNNPLVIGGNTFIGNMHDLRLWNKTISLTNAYAKMYDKLIGNEKNLIGYWPMDEGRGDLTKDLARYKHAVVNTNWDIKPKGTSYYFSGGQYLALDNVDFVQLTNEMDATISFWMKTGISQDATLFSNGKGDGSDIVQTNGLSNKWAINMINSGMLTLESEGNSYLLTSQPIDDDTWHHVTLLFNRIGSLRTYVDAEQVSSHPMTTIGGFSGNKIWLGARGSKDFAGIETVDRTFTGKIDEFRLWNTLRNVEQISRDRFNEVDVESIGLLLYARMNEPDPATGNGPRYYHAYANQTVIPSNALLSTGSVNYSTDVPAIKPERALIKFFVNRVINEDEMIIEPVVTDWASLEGQTVDITVHRMFDDANNMQQSPITWTAYVNRNEVSWFAEGYNNIVDIIKYSGEEKSFEITLLNKGGKGQPFSINNVPNSLHLSSTTGTIPPNSKIVITATVEENLSAGEYDSVLYLQTDLGYDEKMQINLRVLEQEPSWDVEPNNFDYSMNIVGKLKVDGVLSTDVFDKLAAFNNGETRGVAKLVYNEAYQEYYVYLTIYSNSVSGEIIVFNIWDASQGKILQASIDTGVSVVFTDNKLLGTIGAPVIFENTDVTSEEIKLNQGWTWVSLNVNDPNFSDFNTLTQAMVLETDDRIISFSPAYIELYNLPSLNWTGNISKQEDGLHVDRMYKIRLAHEQSLFITGPPVDISSWSFPVKVNWNWLPYPLSSNNLTNEALAGYDPMEGDVIKSQNLFAIYDPLSGWTGTLNYLESTRGYMLKSSSAQTLTYPSYLSRTFNKSASGKNGINNNVVFGTQDETPAAYKHYNANMNAVVSLPEGYNELFVYDGKGNLKGEANNQLVNDKALSFITIYGDLPETLVFYIGDGQSKKPTSKSFDFKANDVLGTVAIPIVLEDFIGDITVFPNPFKNDVTVSIKTLKRQQAVITLYSLTGQLLLTQTERVESGINLLNISIKVSNGIYLMEVKLEEGTTFTRLIKDQ